MYKVYSDGSCLGNPGPGGVGIVIVKDDKVLQKLSFGEAHTTNNQMELLASISGILYVREHYSKDETINIVSDSNYVISGSNTWIHGWKKKNWSGCKKNLDIWKLMDSVNDNCTFTWVKGHADDLYNNMADKLARKAAEKQKGLLNGNQINPN